MSPDNASQTTSYSTRFDTQQREIIEQAADVLGCSAAKLIRDSAVTRSVDVMNAQGGARDSLRRLASRLIRQVFNPEVELDREIGHSPVDDPRKDMGVESVRIDRNTARSWGNQDEFMPEHLQKSNRVRAVRVLRPDDNELRQMKDAFETTGTEFIKLLLEHWGEARAGAQEYQPAIKPHSLLGMAEDSQD